MIKKLVGLRRDFYPSSVKVGQEFCSFLKANFYTCDNFTAVFNLILLSAINLIHLFYLSLLASDLTHRLAAILSQTLTLFVKKF